MTIKSTTTLFLTTFILLLSFWQNQAAAKSNPSEEKAASHLSGTRWKIKQQSFASHDVKGTDTDSIMGKKDDYIVFRNDGRAYSYFDNKHDTLEYKMVGHDSISFGDTPFAIRNLGNDRIELYQNEEEKNGDYNRMWFILEKY